MKILVTGVGGQLGHDVMNELARRGHQGVGSDIAPVYSGIADGSAVTEMPYVPMDITNDAQVRQVMDDVRPDAVIHCAAWTAVVTASGSTNSRLTSSSLSPQTAARPRQSSSWSWAPFSTTSTDSCVSVSAKPRA